MATYLSVFILCFLLFLPSWLLGFAAGLVESLDLIWTAGLALFVATAIHLRSPSASPGASAQRRSCSRS